jgi:hypothetical protein
MSDAVASLPEGPAPGPSSDAGLTIHLGGAALAPQPSGVLLWPDEGALVVGDLHLGRSERMARIGGGLLPPYETQDTLDRLEGVLRAAAPRLVICLGDSFDDAQASGRLAPGMAARLAAMAEGRRWIWVTGNHDPGPVDLPGEAAAEVALGPLTFRHVARPGALAEISAHYHPKARLALRGIRVARPCFLSDARRMILPAFGTYTGGLDAGDPVFDPLMGPEARALLLGRVLTSLPRSLLRR